MKSRHAAWAVAAAFLLLLPIVVAPSASAATLQPSTREAAVLAAGQPDPGAHQGSSPDQASGRDPHTAKAKLDREARRAARTVGAWYVDEATGMLVVEATNMADASAFVAASDAAPEMVQIRKVTETPKPYSKLVGGDPIHSPRSTCSLGFSARSGSTAYVITAGHCTESGSPWSGFNRVEIGAVSASNFPGDDFGTIRVNSTTTWMPTSRVSGAGSLLGSAEAAVGAAVCRSGQTTGYHCGKIQSKNATVNYGGGKIIYGLTRTNVCSEPGDSGGPFVSGRQAQGLTSGGSGDCRLGGTTFFQPINEVLSRLGLTLVTG